MRIDVVVLDEKKRIIELAVTHKGKTLSFGEEKLGIVDTWAPSDLYVEVNGYFATLSDQEADQLFELYAVTQDIIDATIVSEMATALADPIRKIVDGICSIDRMREFIPTLDIPIPDKILKDFDLELARKHRDQTYLRHEYAGLMALMATLKCAYPIWNLYMKILDTNNKEQETYLLLDTIKTIGNTDLFVSDEMVRLFEFTEKVYSLKIGNNEDTCVLDGVGSDKVTAYIFASAIIEKLMRMPINIGDHNTHLITKLYHKIEQDCKSLPSKFKSKVIRREDVRNASEDSKINWLDIFTTKEKVPSSYYILNDMFLRDISNIKECLEPELPDTLIATCLDGFRTLEGKPILGGNHKVPTHQTMVQWILADYIQIHAIPHIGREAMLNSMAVCQAFLIHHGLLAAASLFSAYPHSDEAVMMPMVHITKALQAELTPYCQFNHSTKAADTARLSNPFVVSIEFLTSRISEYQWSLKTTERMKTLLGFRNTNRVIDPNIKNELAQMFLILMRKKYAKAVSQR